MKRIERIKERLYKKDFYTKIAWWGEDETILTNEEVKKEPLVVRKALAIQHLLRYMPASIKDDELIVGIINMASIGSGREFVQYALPEEIEAAKKVGFNTHTVWGHHPVRYERLLEIGADGAKKEIYAKMLEEAQKSDPDPEKMDNWRAMLISLDALIDHAHRYADLCMKAAADESNAKRAAELIEMARVCSRVPQFPAETYHEALQSVWFMYDAMQSCMEMVPVARSDQYLYPYFKKDIDSGRITMEEAEELTGSWLAKFLERVQMNPEHHENRHKNVADNSDGGVEFPEEMDLLSRVYIESMHEDAVSANHWQANMILGGLTRDGKDGTNELTYMLLKQWAYLEAVAPVLSVRIHKETPEKLIEACAAILREGSGEPMLYNDEVIVKGLVDAGIPIEDARDYSNDGCWEVLVPGKTDYSFEHAEVLRYLEHVLNNGKGLLTGEEEAFADTGDPEQFKTYDELYEALLEHLRGFVDWRLTKKFEARDERHKISPSVLLSTFVDDCIEKGRDISNDGAKYNFYSLYLTGFANCVDSLAAIKKLVYEEKKVTMRELTEALRTNFEGKEPLRQMLMKQAPKFGNDNKYVDEIGAKLMKDFDKMMRDSNEREDVKLHHYLLNAGIGTFEQYHGLGRRCGASADGRLSQETLSSNFSPSVGFDLEGPTAAMKSVTCPELLHYYTGGPLDLQINSNEVKGESGLKRMVSLIKSYMELGGVMLTITGVSHEILEAAQKHPENYPGLRVRLGGLSAYFVGLGKEHQDIIIRKTKHNI